MYNPNKKIEFLKGVYRNRTLKYIAPLLRAYGKDFVSLLNKVRIKAFTIGDLKFSDSLSDYIFIIVSIENIKGFYALKNYLQKTDYYVDDYIFSLKNKLHCMVINNPRSKAIDYFLSGRYSQMLSEEDINRFFLKTVTVKGIERYTDVYSILTKRKDYDNIFLDKIKRDFNSNIDKLEESTEYDYPPILGEEVLNTEDDVNIDLILKQQILIDGIRCKESTS